MLLILAVALVAAGVVAAVLSSSRTPAPANRSNSVLPDPQQTLRVKGTTEAVRSRAILAPLLEGQQIPTLTIIRLTLSGTWVKRGDLLVEFDRQAQIRDFVDNQQVTRSSRIKLPRSRRKKMPPVPKTRPS